MKVVKQSVEIMGCGGLPIDGKARSTMLYNANTWQRQKCKRWRIWRRIHGREWAN